MYDVNTKEFKYNYLRSKLKVKQWEEKFKIENGRIPNKADIKESSAKVKYYYKIYWKLKTILLEETIKPSTLDTCESNPVGWNVTEKLFEGSKFKKRNPRKSLKKVKSNTSVESTETVNSQNVSSLKSNSSFASLDTLSSLDSFQTELSPCPYSPGQAPEPCSVENDCSPKIKALIMSKTELSPLFAKSDKFRIVSESKPVHSHPISLVEKVTTERKVPLQSSRKLDVGWIERCSDRVSKLSSDSGFESMESSVLGSSSEGDSKEEIKVSVSDDDDIIGSSDNELDDSRLKFLSLKRKSEDSEPKRPCPPARLPLAPISVLDRPIEQPNKRIKMDPYQFPVETKSASMVKEERLQKKIKQGTLNENFVRINIKKKVFVRGKKNFNFAKHKKQQWKKLKKNLDADENCGIIRCYKCGDVGHFTRYCQQSKFKALPDDFDQDDEEESNLPTLEEAEAMAREKAHSKRKHFLTPIVETIEPEPEETLKTVECLYTLGENGSLPKTPPEVFEALQKFGHSRFRPGQEKAIMRILSGMSTLVTIATGGGKSLCYQLPAYLYATRMNSIALVVSPLVSLMEDQVTGSCSFFKLGCLHTNQTPKQRQSVLDDAKNGKLYALLVSPEAIVAGDNSSGLSSTLKTLPPICFACIDEVHCLSQWSHNFRPSYLMLTKVLREKLGVKTILGLTATATKSTIDSITAELGIGDDGGVIRDVPLPDNLCLSVSQGDKKDKALLDLLKGPRFKDANAILIYCTRRDECERLAVLIRTIHNDPKSAGGSKRLSWNAEAYHAGMSSSRRKQVQRAFMKGNLRIVVATVAFGMGINKQDIRGVIHYNMPRDFESYVQEVGRAGRDGMLAHCHLFLDSDGRDLNELRRHIHSNAVDRHVLRKLLQRVFTECKCKETCPGHEVGFDCNNTVQALDIPEENIYTLLCYLELHPDSLIRVLTPGFVQCKLQSYRGAKAIATAAKKCPPLAVACAQNANALQDVNASSLSFDVIALANSIAWDSGTVKNQLKSVEWNQTKDEKWKKSGIVVDFSALGFRVLSRGNMTPQEQDEALNYLIQRVENQEKRSSDQLDVIFSALTHFSSSSHDECVADYNKETSDKLKDAIRKYFETEKLCSDIPAQKLKVDDFDEEEVASDVRSLICSYRDNSFNGRAVARIFHGIQSPNYPASVWFRCRHWRQHIDKDFNKICRIATKEILRFK